MTITIDPRSGITFPDGSYQNSGMSANANGKTSITLPSGTTAQRPAPSGNCMIRWNIDVQRYEYYDPNISTWIYL